MEGRFPVSLDDRRFRNSHKITMMIDGSVPRRSSPPPSPATRLGPHMYSALRIPIRSCVRRDGSKSWYHLEVWTTAQCRSHGDLRTTCSRTSNWMLISSTKRRSPRLRKATLGPGRGTSSSLGAPVASTYADAWQRVGRPSPSRKWKAVDRCCSSMESL
jgi:hypothetical protein